ncbi:MAG: malate synthase [Frankiales bacterium]|nr:malate synthase [Frankiales bacterium]
MSTAPQVPGVEVRAVWRDGYEQVLTEQSLSLLAQLHREFEGRRQELLRARAARDAELASDALPDFLVETADVRGGDWTVAPAAPGLVDRRVEITGPTDRKMVINALNCGAKVFMADFEDSNTPTFDNLVTGQLNLRDAWLRQIDFTSPQGKSYALDETVATLVVRNRGWHLPERHVLVDGQPVSGSLFDFCMYLSTSGRIAIEKGFGPYFYLPKMESHLEARLWNDVFVVGQEAVRIPRGTIRATCLVETILAAFEMEEILYELREHSSGLNAGRWDYIFSMFKKFRTRGEEFQLPDRADVKMTVPFMRAYTELLVKTCHAHGAHAIGGMAAFIPNRKDAEVNDAALKAVRADKSREADDGFDGSWVAHPDLVPVALEVFDAKLGDTPNQLGRRRDDVHVTAAQLLAARETPGQVTEAGVRNNVSVGIQYLESWLRGGGAVAIFNLMEDAATAEISRSQIWQWVHNGVSTAEGTKITPDWVRRVEDEELEKVRATIGDEAYQAGEFAQARELFEQVALADDFVEFLTLPAYERLA